MVTHDSGPKASLDRLARILDDDDAFNGLERFIETLPDLNATLELVSQFVGAAPRIAENANQIVGTARHAFGDGDFAGHVEKARRAAATGDTLVGQLGPTLTHPETLESLRQLMESLPKLLAVMQMLEQFVQGASRFADNVNGIIATARTAGNENWIELMGNKELIGLPAKVLDLINSPSLQRLLASRVLSDGALHVMDQVASATVDAHAKTVAGDLHTTRFGAFKALGDKDVQHGLALAIELARSMGQHMRAQEHATPSAHRESTNGAGH